MQFDLSDLTIGELADFEEVTGRDPMNLPEEFRPTVKDLLAFAWIIGRRADPSLTIEGARRMRLEDLAGMVPTGAGAAANSANSISAGSRSSRRSTGSRRASSGR
jgi:hypothetical protein